MKQEIWATMIKALPPNLTAKQASRIFRRSISLTRIRLTKYGYAFKEARKYEIPAWAAEADWTLPNIDIARKYNLSRERVRKFRQRLGKPFVEARGRHHTNGTNGKG